MINKYLLIITILLTSCSCVRGESDNIIDYFHIVYIEPSNLDKVKIPREIYSNTFTEYNKITFIDPKQIYYLGKIVYHNDKFVSFDSVVDKENQYAVNLAKDYLKFLLDHGIEGYVVNKPIAKNDPPIRVPSFMWDAMDNKFDDPKSWFAIIDKKTGDEFFKTHKTTGVPELAKGVNIYGDSPGITSLAMYNDGDKIYELPYYSETAVYLSGYGYIGSKYNGLESNNKKPDNETIKDLIDSIK
jgi:hypothetical protein